MKVLFVFSGIPLYMDALLHKIAGKGVEVITVIPTGKSSSLGEGVQVIDGQKARYKIIESDEKKSSIWKKWHPCPVPNSRSGKTRHLRSRMALFHSVFLVSFAQKGAPQKQRAIGNPGDTLSSTPLLQVSSILQGEPDVQRGDEAFK